MTDDSKFGFSEGFQNKVVALLLRDPGFLPNYGDVIDWSYFNYAQLGQIAKFGIEFYDRVKRLPTKESLVEEYAMWCRKFSVPESDIILTTDKIDQVYQLDISDGPYVQEKVVAFGRRSALRKTLTGVISLINNPESSLEDIDPMMQRALAVGRGTREMGSLLFQGLPGLPGRLKKDSYNPENQIKTGIPSLDECCMGGPGIRQVWVVMAKSGIGKSLFCVNVGVAALQKRIAVVHITIADLHEADVELRYAARLTGCTTKQITDNDPQFQNRVAWLINASGGTSFLPYLRTKYFAAGTADIGTIRSYLTQIRSVDGIDPKMVIVDYPDKLRGATDGEGKSYHGMGRIYDGLNGIANDFGVLIWAPSQVQRFIGSNEGDVITIDNIQDSKLKTDNADGAISLNQTALEYRQQRMRLWVDKVRRGKSKCVINLQSRTDIMNIQEVRQ